MKGPYAEKLTGTVSYTPVEYTYISDAIFGIMHKSKALKIINMVRISRKWHYVTDF
jgi:hypothetical protein